MKKRKKISQEFKFPEKRLPEDQYKNNENRKPSIYRLRSSRALYRTVGSHLSNDTDDYCILYRKWDDFGDREDTLYSRTYRTFMEHFDPYEYKEIEIIPTPEQAQKDLQWLLKKCGK